MTSRRRRRGERGAVLPLAVLSIVAIFTSVAMAVDLGRLGSERRSAQADADVIALDLIRLADGRAESAILASNEYVLTLMRSTDGNGIAPQDVTVAYGTYDQTTGAFTETTAAQVPDAVQVVVRSDVDYVFARVFTSDDGQTSRRAVAALDSITSLTLGSRLATVDAGRSDLLAWLLTLLLGQSVTTANLVGYQGLATADVSLADLATAAAVGSPDALLNSNVTARSYGLLMADALRANGQTAQADLIQFLALKANATITMTVGELIDVGTGGASGAADAQVNAFDQLLASLQLFNSKNAVDVCAAVPNLNVVGLVNLASNVCARVIEAAHTAIGRVGSASMTGFQTAQIRTAVSTAADIDLNLVAARVQGRLSLPVAYDGASATGTLTEVLCDRAAGNSTTDTLVTSALLTGTLGSGSTAISTLAVKVLGVTVAQVDIRLNKSRTPSGTSATIADQVIDSTRQGPSTGLQTGLGPITTGDTDVVLKSGLLPGGISLGAIETAVVPVLNSLLAVVESAAVNDFLTQLGVGIATSDLRLNSVDCVAPLLRG